MRSEILLDMRMIVRSRWIIFKEPKKAYINGQTYRQTGKKRHSHPEAGERSHLRIVRHDILKRLGGKLLSRNIPARTGVVEP